MSLEQHLCRTDVVNRLTGQGDPERLLRSLSSAGCRSSIEAWSGDRKVTPVALRASLRAEAAPLPVDPRHVPGCHVRRRDL